MPKIYLLTLGCAKNLVDSEVMLGTLSLRGYQFTADPNEAEIMIINTCGFIQPAREEAHQVIEKALSWKKARPGRVVVVTGCYVERFPDYLKARYPQVDLWTGVSYFDRIDELIEKKLDLPGSGTFLLSHKTPRIISTGPFWAYVKISEGCSHQCSFCSIPLIKGPYKSRTMDSVVREVRNLVALGIREINLISQDTTFYGRDRKRNNGLVRLLEKLLVIKGLSWIRLLYGYPEEVDDHLLELLTEAKMCRYLDLPFQHASEAILKKMSRSMTGTKALKLLEKIRKKVPGVAIRTSLIVGFPGEGRKEFTELKHFVRLARFEHLGVFCYSPEPGTRAESLGDPVKVREKKFRQQEIMSIQKEISTEFYQRFLGEHLEVLIEGSHPKRPGIILARARFQAPEVDGLVMIENWPKEKHPSLPPLVKVKIVRALTYDLVGRVSDD
ncbi:MAG: 30S ribosomal protein S12 methylthiotransferase RimO [Candidatus Saccharicenans sp.]